MAALRCTHSPRAARRFGLYAAGLLVGVVCSAPAVARAEAPPPPPRIVVIGDGSTGVAPNYAEVRAGVTTRGKTAKDATDANTKAMSAIMTTLGDSGVAAKDIQTALFSVQPVYAAPQPGTEQRLTGFAVSNQVQVKIRQIGSLGDVLDKLVTAGATDIGNIAFLHDDEAKLRDAARTAAISDAKRKAELYAQAAGVRLGRVAFITEDGGYGPSAPMMALRAAGSAAVPIAAGEDTLHVRVTVGFDIAP